MRNARWGTTKREWVICQCRERGGVRKRFIARSVFRVEAKFFFPLLKALIFRLFFCRNLVVDNGAKYLFTTAIYLLSVDEINFFWDASEMNKFAQHYPPVLLSEPWRTPGGNLGGELPYILKFGKQFRALKRRRKRKEISSGSARHPCRITRTRLWTGLSWDAFLQRQALRGTG